MNKFLFIALSIILAYLLIFLFPFAWTAIFASIPLLVLNAKKSAISGFAIGFIAPLSIYLLYPLEKVFDLSSIIGSIVGLSPLLLLVIFPLMYGIIMAISAAIWSGIYVNLKK